MIQIRNTTVFSKSVSVSSRELQSYEFKHYAPYLDGLALALNEKELFITRLKRNFLESMKPILS